MSANLVVDVTSQNRTPARYAVVLRVHPARGRTVERCLALFSTTKIPVEEGSALLEIRYANGQIATRLVEVEPGDNPVHIPVTPSPHEAMRALSLSRDPDRPLGLSSRPYYIDGDELIAPPTPPQEFKFGLINKDHATPKVLTDVTYGDTRVIHVEDPRPPDVLRAAKGSGINVFAVRAPDSGTLRVAALPLPWGWTVHAGREAHVAIRPIIGDELPNLQIVPADDQLSAIIGFLTERDQRALALVGEDLIHRAVELMSEKASNPVAAAIALAVLLRIDQVDRVKGWSRNLWHWFPALPDGAALHTAVMLRAPQDTKEWRDDLREAVLAATSRGVPLLSDALRALRSAALALRDVDEDSGGNYAQVAQNALAWCDRQVRAMDNEAVFTTLTLSDKNLDSIWGVTT